MPLLLNVIWRYYEDRREGRYSAVFEFVLHGSPLTLAPSTQAQPLSHRLSFQTFDVQFHNSEFRFQRNADECVL